MPVGRPAAACTCHYQQLTVWAQAHFLMHLELTEAQTSALDLLQADRILLELLYAVKCIL